MTSSSRWTDGQLAHLALRLLLGINIAFHGGVRLPDLGTFVQKTSGGFAATPLPMALVKATLYPIPFVELAIGLAILAGFRLRLTLFVGMLVMALLTIGMSFQQQWDIVGLQLIYALAYFVLLSRASDARATLSSGG